MRTKLTSSLARVVHAAVAHVVIAAASMLAHGQAHAQTQTDASALAPTLTKIRGTGVVTIGHRLDALPFAYLDANKQPIGYAIEICNEIVNAVRRELKLANLRVEYVPVTAANRFGIINSGKADMECGLTVNNPARRKDANYAMPYFFSGPRILTRVNSGIKDFADLKGKRVVSAKGANAIPILQQRIDTQQLRGTRLIQVDNNAQSFALLDKGEADAWVTTDNLLFAYRATAPDPKAYHVVGSYLIVEAVAIVMRKGDDEFKRVVDRTLAGLMLDGVVGRLYTKWFMQPVPVPGLTERRVVDIPMGPLLRDQLRWPSDRPGDE